MSVTVPEPLWDIVEEHLDEAEFLWEQWEHALLAPNYTLDELADGPEARLLAHLDGLVVGGPEVARRLLIPTLDEDVEPTRVRAAALALLLLQNATGAFNHFFQPGIRTTNQGHGKGGFDAVQATRVLVKHHARERMHANDFAAKTDQIQIRFQNLVFLPFPLQPERQPGL